MRTIIPLLTWFFIFSVSLSLSEEGMYPLSEIDKLDLRKEGMQLSAKDIFNEGEVSLIDAIVNLSGCTGSFVSDKGLILTNHHCAYRAIQEASSSRNDYLQDGFRSESLAEEIPAAGYTVRITESYRDVSDDVLGAVHDTMTAAQRRSAIEKKMKSIEVQAEEDYPGKRASVAEMFTGKSYVLFLYTYLKDVRLVYAPPQSIGNFGGDIDNWEWPRHNADFSLMRAYVGPDGRPAPFDSANVPYQPETFLQINPDGVQKNEFAFMLGYPGRTYRHRSSYFLGYLQDKYMPFVKDWYQWQINLMQNVDSNKDMALKLDSRIKSLANTEKNYRGKLKGMRELNLVQKRRQQEKKLQNFVEQNDQLNHQYGDVLSSIEQIYEDRRASLEHDLILDYLRRSVYALYFANHIHKSAIERQKDDLDREWAYMDRNFDRTKIYIKSRLGRYNEKVDQAVLLKLLQKAANLPDDQRITVLDSLFALDSGMQTARKKVEEAYEYDRFFQEDYLMNHLALPPDTLAELKNPFVNWMLALNAEYEKLKGKRDHWSGQMTTLSAQLVNMKKAFLKKDFVPDANGTLRLTYGKIRGYSPSDAVYYEPITTLKGVMEKNTGQKPFNAPDRLKTLYDQKRFGKYKSDDPEGLPVCILYSMDTTGGNSGSPVLNAKGQLIGLNFDRAFEATINDFAWDESYSRSIGVD
ncbi:MAG: S46 family peptidase, partial [Caldithrix sp.]|nr:S46 family peptidase [Caldithrix sp.]